ncbi:MAG TPA: MerR family DNA-binding protein [Pseudonocardiaceae bacterium]|nr:MerR family DNA-binding protein [Pseudonocardiaceae bacterium]
MKRARVLGFALDDVETLLDLAEGGPDSCDVVRDLATAKIADLDRRIAQMRATLARLVETCEHARDRRECPILAEISGDAEDGRR